MSFAKDFIWGVATAAYQIEGAAYSDGRGLSVWDTMCQKPGKISHGQNGDIACDHYNRYKEDVSIMKELGVKAYRLSLSWSRIIPNGIGKVNQAGVEFYNNLFDELIGSGITPYVTLFHWDYPQALFDKGGWLNSDSPQWFADYTSVVMERFSDRVKNWITLNEPQCFVGCGHFTGVHAPGQKYSIADCLKVGHNALLAHGRAVQVIRAESKTKANIGYSPVGVVVLPNGDTAEDIELARQRMFSVADTENSLWNNSWWLDPVYLGKYPADGLKLYGQDAPDFTDEDMEIISTPVDFFGTNIYWGICVSTGQDGKLEIKDKAYDGCPTTALDWPITPECMYWGAKFFYERYKKPIMITENGMANIEWPSLDGKVHDPQRIDYLAKHLSQLERAVNEGVPVKGYFHWSLMDNFEWAQGYSKRFGLIYIDYRNQKRLWKDSAHWYKRVILANGITV